jgi:hypothetical protein
MQEQDNDDNDSRQLYFVIAAATEYSSKRFVRKVKACLSNLLRTQEAGGAERGSSSSSGVGIVVLSFLDHHRVDRHRIENEKKDTTIVHATPVPLLIRALNAAHREIRDAPTLSMVLESLSDPSVIPTAVLCSSVIPFYVIPEYIKSRQRNVTSGSGSSEKAMVLMNYLSRWMDEFPSLPLRALEAVRRFSRSASAAALSSYGKAVILELYQHWFRSYPRLRIPILTNLNDWLADQYQPVEAAATAADPLKKRRKGRDQGGTHHEEPYPVAKKRRRRTIISLNRLHDGGSSSEDDHNDQAKQRSPPAQQTRRSRPLGQAIQTSDLTFSVTLLHATVELSHRLMTLSSHYEALVPRCADVRSLVVCLLLEPTEATLLHDAVAMLQGERDKLSMRLLCALTVVNFKPDVIVAVCLSRYRCQPSLLIYVVELLIECQFYDNKRHLLAVLDQIPMPSGDDSWQHTLRKCLYTKRKKLLVDSTNEAVQRLLCDNILLDDDEGSFCLLSLRSTMDLLSSRLCSRRKPALRFPDDFLSQYSPANSMPPQEHTKEALENGHLSDECWFQIASFLNYKRVCKLRLVSSSLNNIMGTPLLWKRLYESRYPQHPVRQEEAKQLFRERITAERSIRGRCCQSDLTWRVQLCPLPGCLHVLTTRARAAAHAKRHQLKKKKLKSRRAKPKKSQKG